MTPDIQQKVKDEMAYDLEKQAIEAEIHAAYIEQSILPDLDTRTVQLQSDIETEQRTIDEHAESHKREDRDIVKEAAARADGLKTAKRKYEKQREEAVKQTGQLRGQATALRDKRAFVEAYNFDDHADA